MMIPNVDEILAGFLKASCNGRQLATSRRYQHVDAQLRKYLEAAGHRFLNDDKVELLGLEQAYQLDGACSRIMDAEDLLYSLPDFLRDPWLMTNNWHRRSQIAQTSRLAQWLCSQRLVDSALAGCAMIETRLAVDYARRGPDPRPS
ncbi:hypothetical protein [Arthrobacter castelli]|uniref:hypothetical protein n=1 Tax=Arthrobacter castelli TaxID=271431 RepID=UPI00047D5CB8|nr:hypothetical protein [Arthrobacter castelli]